MIKQFARFLQSFFLMALYSIVVISIFFFIWIYTGSRSIPLLSSEIEETISNLSSEFDVKIDGTFLRWEGLSEGLSISIKHIAILKKKDKNGLRKEVVAFPEIKAKLDMVKLMFGSVILKDMFILSPEIKISSIENKRLLEVVSSKIIDTNQGDKGNLLPNPLTIYQRIIVDILSAISANNKEIPINNILMNHVRIIFNNGERDIVWYLPEVSTKFLVVGDIVMFKTAIKGDFLGKEMSINGEGYIHDKKWLRVRTDFDGVYPELAVDLFPKLGWVSGMNLLFKGEATFFLSPLGKVSNVDFKMSTINQDNSHKLPKLLLWGDMDIYENYKGLGSDLPEIHLNISASGLPMDKLDSFWPPQYARPVKNWISENISGGMYNNATVKINIMPDDILNWRLERKMLPDKAIIGKVDFFNAEVKYYQNLPVVKEAIGTAKFTSNSMNLSIRSAKIGNSDIKNAYVNIADMAIIGKAKIYISSNIVGGVEDLLAYKDFKKNTYDPFLSNIEISEKQASFLDKKKITGTAKSFVEVEFPLKKNMLPEEFKITVSSVIEDIKLPSIIKGVDINGGKISAIFNNSSINVEGNINLNSSAARIKYSEDFLDKNKYKREYSVSSFMTMQELSKIGQLSSLASMSGGVNIDLLFQENDLEKKITGKIDATKAAINLAKIGLIKRLGEKTIVSFVADSNDNANYKVRNIAIKSDSLDILGRAELKPDIQKITLSRVKYGKNNFQLNFEINKSHVEKVEIYGDSLDLEPLLKLSKVNLTNIDEGNIGDLLYKKERIFPQQINFKIDKLFMANDILTRNTVGFLKCKKKYCTEASYKSEFENGSMVKISFSKKDMDSRVLKLNADNLGTLLRGLNFSKHINGGAVELSAISPNKSTELQGGKIIGKKFRVIKAPLLAKLLTIGSLTGFVDILDGQGISFKKMKGEFTYKNGVIKLAGIKSFGNSLGITADGYINIKEKEFDLDGAIIPSYSINSFLGKIPLIGGVFVAKDGEGVIATRYKIRGALSDPEITVNPFSMLTPGFLRLIWGGKNIELPSQRKIKFKPKKLQ